MNLVERKKVPGINKNGDIMLRLNSRYLLMNYLDSDRIMFSKSGLREGILSERLHEIIQENIKEQEKQQS